MGRRRWWLFGAWVVHHVHDGVRHVRTHSWRHLRWCWRDMCRQIRQRTRRSRRLQTPCLRRTAVIALVALLVACPVLCLAVFLVICLEASLVAHAVACAAACSESLECQLSAWHWWTTFRLQTDDRQPHRSEWYPTSHRQWRLNFASSFRFSSNSSQTGYMIHRAFKNYLVVKKLISTRKFFNASCHQVSSRMAFNETQRWLTHKQLQKVIYK